VVPSGSILPPISGHVIANIMGLPQLGWDLRQHANHKLCVFSVQLDRFV
jgi:hypothetical protein